LPYTFFAPRWLVVNNKCVDFESYIYASALTQGNKIMGRNQDGTSLIYPDFLTKDSYYLIKKKTSGHVLAKPFTDIRCHGNIL